MRYTHLLFDADGTLFDFEQAETEALKQTLARRNLPFSPIIRSRYREINQTLWDEFEQGRIQKEELKAERFGRLLTEFNVDDDPSAVNQIYVEELAKCSFLFEDALSVCQQLSAHCELAIITNGIAEVQHSRFNRSPLSNVIPHIFVSESIGFQKPQASYFDAVLSSLEISDRRTVLVIGDSLTADIAGGLQSGLDTCWFNPANKKSPPETQPTYMIGRLNQIQSIVFGQELSRA